MKPKKLSKKLNPSGDTMNLQDAFNKIKNTKHDSSFEQLGDWLNQNKTRPKKMKTFYKIAASLLLTAFVLIACSIPVQHEEEIGFMIKGTSTNAEHILQEKMCKSKAAFGNQIGMSFSAIQIDGESPVNRGEVILLLPNADEAEARAKMKKLNSTFDFTTIDLHLIEEKVDWPFYKAALSKININFGDDLSDEFIVEQFNKALHENSNLSGNAEISKDANGNRIVEIVIEEVGSETSKDMLNTIDPNSIKSITIKKEGNTKVVDIEIEEVVKNN